MSSEIKARFSVSTKIHKCAAEPRTSYALGDMLLTPAAGGTVFLTATDGKMLAIARADGETDDAHLVPAVAATEMELNGQWQATNRTARTAKTTLHPVCESGRYPAVPSILPVIDADDYHMLTINPKMLLAIKEAIVAGNDLDGLTLLIPKKAGGAVLAVGDAGIGVVMPMSDGFDRPALAARQFNQTVDEYRGTFKQAAECEIR